MNKRMAYIDQIACEVKNILIDRTHDEISQISIVINWVKGEDPHIYWDYKGYSEHDVTIVGELTDE